MPALETEADAYILDGHLAVIVEGRIHPAEPDVGCGESAEIDEIYFSNGKPIPSRMWQRLSQKDLDACTDALMGAGRVSAWERRQDWLADRADARRDDALLRQWEASL